MAILITAASTAKAYQVKSTLTEVDSLLGDYEELPVVMLTLGKMIRLPNPANAAYIHEILALCLDKNIGTIYPLRHNEQQLLAEALQLFDEYGIKIINIPDAL